LAAVQKRGFDGIGFVFSPQDRYMFVDLDGCRDPRTGKIEPWAVEVVDRLNSYTAISISGTGLHIYVEASEAASNRIGSRRKGLGDAKAYGDKRPGVEIYVHSRYAALSGQHLDGSPREIRLNDDGLMWLVAKYWGGEPNSPPETDKPDSADEPPRFQAQAGERGWPTPPTPAGEVSGGLQMSEWLLSESEVESRIKDAVTRQGPDFYSYYRNPQQTLAGGNSASEFECRLVACALIDRWSLTEIQSLLYRFRIRRRLPNPEKAFRKDYVDGTIAHIERTRDNFFEEFEPNDDPPDETPTAKADAEEDVRVRLDKFPLTESGNAERLIARHGGNLRYTADESCWYVWSEDEGHWERDPAGDIVGRLYVETMRATYASASGLRDELQRKQLQSWARKSESAARVKSGFFLARASPAIRCKASDFENRPWLLNVKDTSGATITIELKTGKLRPPSRGDMMVHVLTVVYDPAAQCPKWRQFIREITCERDALGRFLQRVAAYCLTGDVGEQVFFFAYGSGANGKSTFVGVLLRLLGPYGQRSMSDTFWAEKNNMRTALQN
jgi:putative DNA primase/helicase